MSWWVYLQDRTAAPECDYGTPLDQWKPKHSYDDGPCPSPCYPCVIVDSHEEGGTYVLGGSDVAEINITYNYGGLFREAMGDDGIDLLHDKRAGDVIDILERAVEKLGTEQDDDYWNPTPGNAGRGLATLLKWARQHPDAVFKVS